VSKDNLFGRTLVPGEQGGYKLAPTFEDRMVEAAQESIIKLLESGDWLKVSWDDKLKISATELRAIFNKVDMNRVHERVLAKVEERIANAIIENMATEIGTDVKKIFCNTELREDLRSIIREKIRASNAALSK